MSSRWINNFATAVGGELLGIEISERLPVPPGGSMIEISRICDHLTFVGAGSMELVAFTCLPVHDQAREFSSGAV